MRIKLSKAKYTASCSFEVKETFLILFSLKNSICADLEFKTKFHKVLSSSLERSMLLNVFKILPGVNSSDENSENRIIGKSFFLLIILIFSILSQS